MLAPSKPVFKCLIEGFLLSIKRKYIKGILLSIKAYNNAHNAFNPNVFIFHFKKNALHKRKQFPPCFVLIGISYFKHNQKPKEILFNYITKCVYQKNSNDRSLTHSHLYFRKQFKFSYAVLS